MLVTLNDILPAAQAGHYAVGLFNTTDSDMLEAAISAGEGVRVIEAAGKDGRATVYQKGDA